MEARQKALKTVMGNIAKDPKSAEQVMAALTAADRIPDLEKQIQRQLRGSPLLGKNAGLAEAGRSDSMEQMRAGPLVDAAYYRKKHQQMEAWRMDKLLEGMTPEERELHELRRKANQPMIKSSPEGTYIKDIQGQSHYIPGKPQPAPPRPANTGPGIDQLPSPMRPGQMQIPPNEVPDYGVPGEAPPSVEGLPRPIPNWPTGEGGHVVPPKGPYQGMPARTGPPGSSWPTTDGKSLAERVLTDEMTPLHPAVPSAFEDPLAPREGPVAGKEAVKAIKKGQQWQDIRAANRRMVPNVAEHRYGREKQYGPPGYRNPNVSPPKGGWPVQDAEWVKERRGQRAKQVADVWESLYGSEDASLMEALLGL
jgi:hypothetical protein